MKTISLIGRVTDEDIELGVRDNCYDCALARAMRRCEGVEFVTVLDKEVEVEAGNETFGCPLPNDLQEWIARFDAGLAVSPVAFDLELEREERWDEPDEEQAP